MIAVAFIVTLQTANRLRLYNSDLSASLPGETSWLPSVKEMFFTCPDGQSLDASGVCVPNEGFFTCPDGHSLDDNQVCVPNEGFFTCEGSDPDTCADPCVWTETQAAVEGTGCSGTPTDAGNDCLGTDENTCAAGCDWDAGTPTEGTCGEAFADFEEGFSVYPNSGAKYSYSLY